MTVLMDTHLHSKASDGKWTPEEVVIEAKKRGIKAIALTDHDTVFGVSKALRAATTLNGIRVMPGIEIYADYKKGAVSVKDIELLGLGINLEGIEHFAEERWNSRVRSLKSYINAFNAYIDSPGFEEVNRTQHYSLQNLRPTGFEDIISWRKERDKYENKRPFLSRVDVVYYLLENFAVPSENVSRILRGERKQSDQFKKDYKFLFDKKEEKPTFYEAIKAVKDAGGIAILAHPGRSRGYTDGMVKPWERPEEKWLDGISAEFTPLDFVQDLLDRELDGVELYYYEANDWPHAENQGTINKYFGTLAEKLGIITTYGSDCHGPRGNGPLMGKFGSDRVYLEELL